MSHYTTTNIRLPDELLQDLKMEAVRERKSMAELIRGWIYEKRSYKPPVSLKGAEDHHPLLNIIGIGSSGVRDGSVHHDQYLYSARKKRSSK